MTARSQTPFSQDSGEGMPVRGLGVEASASAAFDPSPEFVPLYQHANVTAMARREVMVRMFLRDPEEIVETAARFIEGDNILDGIWVLTQRSPRPIVGSFYPMHRILQMDNFIEGDS